MDQAIFLEPIMLYRPYIEKAMAYQQVPLMVFATCFLSLLKTLNQIQSLLI
jgi:hypothetical protein